MILNQSRRKTGVCKSNKQRKMISPTPRTRERKKRKPGKETQPFENKRKNATGSILQDSTEEYEAARKPERKQIKVKRLPNEKTDPNNALSIKTSEA
jgi:hypothetical protein